MLILPDRELWTPEPRELWVPETSSGRTRRRGGFIAPDRGLRQQPLYATITRNYIGIIGSGTNATAYSAAMNQQPSSGRLELIGVANTVGGSGTAPLPSGISGNGLTYTNVTSITFQSGTIGVRLSAWRAMGTTTGTGVFTVSFGATQTSCCALAVEYDGIDTSGTNGSGAIGNIVTSNNLGSSHAAGDFTTSLALSNVANRPVVFTSDMAGASDWTALANWVAGLASAQSSPTNNLFTSWRSDALDITVGATHATTSNVGLIGLELVAAASASAVMRRTLSNIGTRTGARQGI